MINACDIKELTIAGSAVIGVIIALYRLVLKPRVHYSIDALKGLIQQTVEVGSGGPMHEDCDGRVIRIQNKSFLPMSAKKIFIHVRANSPFRNVTQSGIYTTQVSPTDGKVPSKDLTFYLEFLPPGGKLKLEFLCWKRERPYDKPFFADHAVMTADGKVKKVSRIKGFDDPYPAD